MKTITAMALLILLSVSCRPMYPTATHRTAALHATCPGQSTFSSWIKEQAWKDYQKTLAKQRKSKDRRKK